MTRRTSAIHILLAIVLIATLAFQLVALPAPVTAGDEMTTEEEEEARSTGPRFVIRPIDGVDGGFFTLEADAGTVNELTVVLGNADDVDLTLRTFVQDVVPRVNGGFAVADEENELTGTSLWIDYPAETFTFEPGSGIERTFTVTIPEDAEPGQYITGLVLQTAESLEVEGSTMFRQIIRKTIAVFIIVPGPEEPSFEIGEPEVVERGRGLALSIPIANTGNVLVRPEGELVVSLPEGDIVMTAPIEMRSVYAGLATSLEVPLMSGLEDGDYLVTLTLEDARRGGIEGFENLPIAVESPDDTTVIFESEVTVSLLPDPSVPVYAEIVAEITNAGSAVNAVLELDVLHDGELVETFDLAPSLALPPGATSLTQRYIPPSGFDAGTWSFVLRLNVVDPSTGAVTTVLTLDDLPPVEVDE